MTEVGVKEDVKQKKGRPKVRMTDLTSRIMASSAGDNLEQMCIDNVFKRITLSHEVQHPFKLSIADPEVEKTLPPKLVENLRRMKIKRFLPVQRYALPLLTDHDVDVFIGAATGHGKTLAFLIPIAIALLRSPRSTSSSSRPRALIIANTQVLQLQTYNVCQSLITSTGLRAVLVCGETNVKEQEKAITTGVDIVIATAGRLLDLLKRRVLILDALEYYIYDEADKMTQGGAFKESVTEITETYIPKEIKPRLRSCFVTATLSGVTAFNEMFREGQWVSVEVPGNPLISHHIIPLKNESEPYKRKILMRLLMNDLTKQGRHLNDTSSEKYKSKTVVFVGRKLDCNFLTAYLTQYGFSVGAANSDLSFSMRNEIIEKFVDGRIQALIATDSMARGHDIPEITHVINYDFINDLDTFKHRAGRTARIGNIGTCTTLLTCDYFKPEGLNEDLYFPDRRAIAFAHYLVLECGQRIPECMHKPAMIAIQDEVARWGGDADQVPHLINLAENGQVDSVFSEQNDNESGAARGGDETVYQTGSGGSDDEEENEEDEDEDDHGGIPLTHDQFNYDDYPGLNESHDTEYAQDEESDGPKASEDEDEKKDEKLRWSEEDDHLDDEEIERARMGAMGMRMNGGEAEEEETWKTRPSIHEEKRREKEAKLIQDAQAVD